MILAGVETPAAAITPASSKCVSWIQARVEATAAATDAEEETSVSKKRAEEGRRVDTSVSPREAFRSRIATLAPRQAKREAVARPRPEALRLS